jgi:predicted tellurium resistance membrane protein TerC
MTEILSVFADPTNWAAIAALITMEVVLGIDNLIFISILTNKLPEQYRAKARRIGIGLALGMRLILLSLIAFIVTLTQPLFEAFGHGFSWRDLILIAGGLFLVWKATAEIHHSVDSNPNDDVFDKMKAGLGFSAAIVQIILLDLVFSIDSIITAVGMTDEVPIMFLAVIIAVIVMLTAAGPLSRFIERNPTVVMLALAFLFMIGMTLIAEGFGTHVPKGYIYAAMAFSVAVESLNIMARYVRAKRDQTSPANTSIQETPSA